VKIIKNRKLNPANMFICALILLLLLLSMIGITVLAKKPDTPGKSSPEPETFNYQIWIGIGALKGEGVPEDLVLEPYNDPLLVADICYSGRWLPPPTKGKKNIEGWGILLEKLEGEYCGIYDINDASLIDVLNDNGYWPINDKDVFRFSIQHRLMLSPNDLNIKEKADYWFILIDFEIGTYGPKLDIDPPIDITHFLMLEGQTDTGLEPEGEYNEKTDTWTVYFNEVWFKVVENSENGEIEELWTGQLSFTVKIMRSLAET
jgi:hypothetical protein